MSDIAARAFSSSCVSCLYSICSPMRYLLPGLGGLVDVDVLNRVRVRDGVVREDVRGDRGVDRSGDVRVDQRHRGALRQLLARELVELLARELPVLRLLRHAVPPFRLRDLGRD